MREGCGRLAVPRDPFGSPGIRTLESVSAAGLATTAHTQPPQLSLHSLRYLGYSYIVTSKPYNCHLLAGSSISILLNCIQHHWIPYQAAVVRFQAETGMNGLRDGVHVVAVTVNMEH